MEDVRFGEQKRSTNMKNQFSNKRQLLLLGVFKAFFKKNPKNPL